MINLQKLRKKRTKVQNVPKKLSVDLYLHKGDLQPIPAVEGDGEVKLEPEEIFAERKAKGTGL